MAEGHVPPQLGDVEADLLAKLPSPTAMASSILSTIAGQVFPSSYFMQLITIITQVGQAYLSVNFSAIRKIVTDFLFEQTKKIQANFNAISPGLQTAIEKVQITVM